MKELTEEHYQFVQQYNDLLETVEEGLDYVEKSYQDLSKTEGDRVLSDCFLAFSQINQANETMKNVFSEEQDTLPHFQKFTGVVNEISKLEAHFENQEKKQQIVTNNIIPAFEAWKTDIQRELTKYLNQ